MLRGSELMLKQIRRDGASDLLLYTVDVLAGVVLTFIGYMYIVSGIKDFIGFIFLLYLLFGIPLGIFLGGEMVGAIRVLVNPLKDPKIRSDPEILAMADEVCTQPIYHDKFVISKRIIANANNLREITYLDEVFLADIDIYWNVNFKCYGKRLWLKTARGVMNIYIRRHDEPKEKLALIKQYCRYVRFGYTDEGMAYAKQMCEAWQRERSEKTPEETLRKTYYLGQADADNGKWEGKRRKDKHQKRKQWKRKQRKRK